MTIICMVNTIILIRETSEILNNTKSQNGRIVAIGSTSVRTLESLPELKASSGITDIFIHPPYDFKYTDCILITSIYLNLLY